MDLGMLTDAIDRLVEIDPAGFSDCESIEALYRERARLESFVTSATAAFDASGSFVPDGARNAAAWLSARCHLPRAESRRQVRRGRELRHLDKCASAFTTGEIGTAQVDAIVALHRDCTAKALERDEEMLVEQAKKLRYSSFTRALCYWGQLADPDGAEADDASRRDRREVYLAASFEGLWLGKITLDPIGGSIVATELESLEHELFEADWAAARAELGREPTAGELARSGAQRRADALVEMATRSRTAPANGRRPAPLFSVFVGYETLHGRICELANGMVVSPGSLLAWLDQAYIERAVFAPGGRVEVSATTRLFTGATRRAIELSDRECTHLYCDGSAGPCQVDHILPYADGGLTTQDNGRLLCGFHNRLRNQRPPPVK